MTSCCEHLLGCSIEGTGDGDGNEMVAPSDCLSWLQDILTSRLGRNMALILSSS